ncbi:MAG: hypothetical protein ACPG19_05300 [Saprospiraceae bacterium]
MSNFENNILDGEELIQNAPFQSSFSARWTKIERILYPAHIIILILFLILYIIFFFNMFPKGYHTVYDIEFLGSILIILSIFLSPTIYIHQFRKLRKRYLTYNSIENNRRLAFQVIPTILFLISIILVLFLGTLIYLAVYLSSEASTRDITLIGYALLISIPLFILNSFLTPYYIYSMLFVYRINKEPIDDILN